MQDPGIIRARAKIEAVIGNARALLAMEAKGESLSELAWGIAGGKPRLGDGEVVQRARRSPRKCRRR